MPAKKKSSDFRYDTGAARVPWAAVGEPLREEDCLAVMKFLLPPLEGQEDAYAEQLKRVGKQIATLRKFGKYAGKLTLGSNVKALEKKAAKLLRAKYALFLTNATAGFEIAYQFAGLRPGDEVIAPAITFIATIAYPLSIGAKVVLADVDPRTLNMDPADVARKVTAKTKVIIPVHLGGYPVDMDPIMRLAKARDITVIEDAAHAFGGSYKGKMAGAIGHFGSFSFHEVKNINAFGEGGLLVTNTAFGAEFSRSRFLGLDLSRQIPHWLYDVPAIKGKGGYFAPGNHSATEIQAVCLGGQMDRLTDIIAKRRAAARYLNGRFSKVAGIIVPPLDSPGIRSTHHLYLLQVDPGKAGGDVQKLKTKLQQKGVVNIPHFAPLYKFSIMRQLGYDTKAIERTCPVAEEAFRHRFTHLPLYELTAEQLQYMADAVIASVEEMKARR